MRRVRLAAIVVLLGLASQPIGAFADPATTRAPEGHVNDFAGVLRPDDRQRLEQRLVDLERTTGAEVALLTVERVPNGDIERAAVDQFQAWGVGKRGRDNGVLILCAIQDRAVRIEVGYGLEPILPDSICSRIIRERMVPAFRRGDFSTGLVDGTEAVAKIIERGEPARVEAPAKSVGDADANLALVVVIIGFFILQWMITSALGPGVWMRRRRWWDDPWNGGGWSSGGFGGGSGGFGGFGGGSSGGGGASGGW